jgi:hypothetical protein
MNDLILKVLELALKQNNSSVGEKTNQDDNSDNWELCKDFIGKQVLLRTYSSGTIIETLKSVKKDSCVLLDSRQLYSWSGINSLTLKDVCENGCDKVKISCTKSGESYCPSFIMMEILSQKAINFFEKYDKSKAYLTLT